jgi:hypothetical protein
LVEIEEAPKSIKTMEKQTRTCTVCGNEADMIVDLEN